MFDSLGRTLRRIGGSGFVKKRIAFVDTFLAIGSDGAVNLYGLADSRAGEDYSLSVAGTVLSLDSDGVDRLLVLVGHASNHLELLTYNAGCSSPSAVKLIDATARCDAIHAVAFSWHGPVLWGDCSLSIGHRIIEFEGIEAATAYRGTIAVASAGVVTIWSAAAGGVRRSTTVAKPVQALAINEDGDVVVALDDATLIVRQPDFTASRAPRQPGACVDLSRDTILTAEGFARGDGQIIDPGVADPSFVIML